MNIFASQHEKNQLKMGHRPKCKKKKKNQWNFYNKNRIKSFQP